MPSDRFTTPESKSEATVARIRSTLSTSPASALITRSMRSTMKPIGVPAFITTTRVESSDAVSLMPNTRCRLMTGSTAPRRLASPLRLCDASGTSTIVGKRMIS